ncbi:MAG: hypothetical protein WC881_06790, partial [Elusimicrobiota bacterium]
GTQGNASAYGSSQELATLAVTPSTRTPAFLQVALTSATLAWYALPPAPSSRSAQGYVLEASTAADFTGAIFSSATAAMAQSTLTVSELDLSNTYYFRIGSLNHASAINRLDMGKLNLQIVISSSGLSLGAMDAKLYTSTVSVSSIVVTNVGNIPVSLLVWGSTATSPYSPWMLGESPGIETVLLQGLWNSDMPAPSEFFTPITGSARISEGPAGDYAGNQDGESVVPGESVTMWFKFWRPTSTESDRKEKLRVDYRAVYP